MADFWVVRECESELRRKILAYRKCCIPLFFYVRGRREVGKTATVRRLCAELLPSAHVFLDLTQAAVGSHEPFRALFPDRRLAAVDEIAARIRDLIVREAVVVVIDEFHRCARDMHGHLKTVVDEIKLGATLVKRPCGGLVVLGSQTRLMDTINGGLDCPLWHRLEWITLPPLAATETALVLQHLGITGGCMLLAVSFLTGGYPEFLRCVATHLTANSTHAASTVVDALWALLPALSLHQGTLENCFLDELGLDMARLGKIVCGIDPFCPLSDADVIRQAATALGTDTSLAEYALNRLQRDYGVVALEAPMVFERVCLAAGALQSTSLRCTNVYTIRDTRLIWHNALHHKREASLNRDDNAIVSEADFSSRIHPHLGIYLKRCVCEIAAHRSRELNVVFPAWRPEGDDAHRVLLADVLGNETPIILSGRQCHVARDNSGQYGDLGFIALYPSKKAILVASCKLDSARLEDELLPDAMSRDCPTQLECYVRDLRERVRAAWPDSRPGSAADNGVQGVPRRQPDSILDDEAVAQYVELLLGTETVFHFVYISPDLDASARPVTAFCNRMRSDALARTWFLSMADMCKMDTAPCTLQTTVSNSRMTVVVAVAPSLFTPKVRLTAAVTVGIALITLIVWRSRR